MKLRIACSPLQQNTASSVKMKTSVGLPFVLQTIVLVTVKQRVKKMHSLLHHCCFVSLQSYQMISRPKIKLKLYNSLTILPFDKKYPYYSYVLSWKTE